MKIRTRNLLLGSLLAIVAVLYLLTGSAVFAKEVSVIEDVDILCSTPSDGFKPIWDPEVIYGLPSNCSFRRIIWYENGITMDSPTRFVPGSNYSADIILTADAGYSFAEGIMGKVNGKSIPTVLLNGKTQIMLSVDLGTCPTAVTNLAIYIEEPHEGNKPSKAVSSPDGAHYGVYSRDVFWTVSEDGVRFTEMAEDAVFESGKYYSVSMDVNLSSKDYAFKITTANGIAEPKVVAFVNWRYADVFKAYDRDPERTITVSVNFGMCNDSIVENIAVVDVQEPAAGERPSYTYNILGTGYRMDSAKNRYEDDYMPWDIPEEERRYYIKNGIGWFDLTKGDWMYDTETFIPGHEYQVNVYLLTEDGYEFAHDKWYEALVTAAVNGKEAVASLGGSDCVYSQQIKYTFTCEKREVSAVILYDLDAPSGGKTPDTAVTEAYPELYSAEYVNWYDCEDNLLGVGDTFRSGERYKVEIRIVAKEAAQFVSPMAAYIDGEEVSERLNWDCVTVDGDAVIVRYTFMKGAAAPELGVAVTGSVFAFSDDENDVVLQLIPAGQSEAVYEITVKGNESDYSFPSVARGMYTLKATKANHLTVEYSIAVESEAVVLDVMLKLTGDITGDGWVNILDAIDLFRHSMMPDLYPISYNGGLDCNMDGDINILDAIALFRYSMMPDLYPIF